MPTDNDALTTTKVSAREAAIERATAYQAATADAPPDGGEPAQTGGPDAATPAAPTDQQEQERAGTPEIDVSDAARTLARRRAELREQVRKEMEAAGELESAGAEGEGTTDGEQAATSAGEDADGSTPVRPPTVAEQETAAEIGPVSVKDESELPELPNGFVWVEIPANSPLRADRGHTHVPSAKGAEDYIRAQLNNPIRNRQVQDAERRAAEAERRMAELEARIKARESEEAKALADNPRINHLLEDIKKSYGEDSEEYKIALQGINAQLRDIEEQYAEKVREELDARGVVNQFWQSVSEYAPQRYKAWAETGELQARIMRAVNDPDSGYARYLNALGNKRPDVREFFTRWLDAEYASDPRAVAAHRSTPQQETEPEQKIDIEAIKDEIRAELRREAEEARKKRASNPLGKLPPSNPAPRDNSARGTETPTTPTQYKRQMRERALARIGGGTA